MMYEQALSPNSAPSARTIRTADAFSSGVYLASSASRATVPSAWLHPRFQGQEPSSISRAIHIPTRGEVVQELRLLPLSNARTPCR